MTQDRTAMARTAMGPALDLPAGDVDEAGATVAEQPPVDETVIDQLASITDADGASVLGELLSAFLGAVPDRLQALDRAAAAGEMVAVADQAHSLTGSAASFGARGMADLCRALRAAAQGGDAAGARRLVESLHDEFLRVRAWLVAFRERT